MLDLDGPVDAEVRTGAGRQPVDLQPHLDPHRTVHGRRVDVLNPARNRICPRVDVGDLAHHHVVNLRLWNPEVGPETARLHHHGQARTRVHPLPGFKR